MSSVLMEHQFFCYAVILALKHYKVETFWKMRDIDGERSAVESRVIGHAASHVDNT